MTTINTIKTTVKAGLVGLVAAAGFGLLTLPVKADEINQDSVQTTVQEGRNNTSVNQSNQDATIKNSSRALGRSGHDARSERDVINQSSDQLNDQVGDGNTAINQNDQDASIDKDTREIRSHRERSIRHHR